MMERKAHKLLENLNNLHELGRQRCFELGNPFYYQDVADKDETGNERDIFYRKELNSGEMYLVTLKITENSNHSFTFQDTVIRQIH